MFQFKKCESNMDILLGSFFLNKGHLLTFDNRTQTNPSKLALGESKIYRA